MTAAMQAAWPLYRSRRRAAFLAVSSIASVRPMLDVALSVLAVSVFGLLEYVNYFVVRLAYPVGRWFTSVVQWRHPAAHARHVRAPV